MSIVSDCGFRNQRVCSQGSSASKKSKASNYRTVSQVSQIEEALFGEPNHIKIKKTTITKEKCSETDIVVVQKNTRTKSDKEEHIRIISKDMVRNLKIHMEDPSLKSTVLNYKDLWRLRERSKIVSVEDKLLLSESIVSKQEQEMKASQDRRQEIKRFDMARINNDKLTDLDEEAYHKSRILLKKAMAQREEQEDEIKELNELITNAKIQAIRDAQITEKEVMKREGEEEELRLDRIMEIDRVNSIVIQDQIRRRRREEEKFAAREIIQQIEENEQEKLLEIERKDQENNVERQRVALLMQEEIERRRNVKSKQEHLRDELSRANIDMVNEKKREKEREILLDFRILEIQREKAAREAAFEAEALRVKIQKEKEVIRLRGLQERAKDEQSERDEKLAKRAMEKAERDWRKKELEEAERKKEIEDDLKQARADQSIMKEHFLAMQASRDRSDFERTLRVQKELMEREKEGNDLEEKKRKEFCKDIKFQIRRNEEAKIEERCAFFKEGEKISEEARLKRGRLEEAKNKKLQELKDAGISDKFVRLVERKIRHQQ